MVTVVIPLYNAETTITKALDSVRNQTAASLIRETIVVNDGSTDNSESVVGEYIKQYPDFHIKYIHQENAGAAAARNAGMQNVQTKYIAFLDADDIWLPDKLKRQMEVMKEHPQIRFLGTAWEDKPLQIGRKKITELYNGSVKDVCIKNFPVTPSILMETAFIDEIGYFDSHRRFAEDINYFQKIAARGNYYFLPEKLVEIDVGKSYFAQSGLSAHLKEMHLGTLQNIRELRDDKQISGGFWLLMRIFYELKYIRRILMRKIRGGRRGSEA